MATHSPHNRKHTTKRNPIQIPEPGQKTKPSSPRTNKSPPTKTKFLPVINSTDIAFSEQELALLQKGPKYNLHNKPKNWIQNLALEAETAIAHLLSTDREVYRKITAERINTLQLNNPQHTHNTPGSQDNQEHQNETKRQ